MRRSLTDSDLVYFRRGGIENPRFFSRFGRQPSFRGRTVLDLGCGYGSLCVFVASLGARRVVGLDINPHRIRFARENLAENFPQFAHICQFRCADISGLTERFDIIICKDTFEHIIDLGSCVAQVAQRLQPGGCLYVGFGPLWHNFNGDHGWTRARIPWGHLIIPEAISIRRASMMRMKMGARPVDSISHLGDGLNKLAARDYYSLFRRSGLRIEYLRVNAGRHPMLKLFSLIARLPPVEKYFVQNIYCIMCRAK